MIYVDFSPIIEYIRGFDSYNRVHRDVCIVQILLEFSLTWIRLIWLLAFHMPWDRSNLTLHYPLWSYIRNPLVHWRHIERLKQRNYSPLLPELHLSLHPFVPLEHCCVLPKLAFVSELAIGVLEDWGGGGPSGGFSFFDSQTCHQRLYLSCNLWFILIRTIFPCPMMCIWMNVASIGICQMLIHYWLYMLE